MEHRDSYIRLIVAFTLLLLCAQSISAQNYYTRTYNYRTGLPPSYFYDLEQDSVGRIWGVNAAGLYSFNGFIWEKYPIPIAEDDIRGDHPRKLYYHRNTHSLYVYYDDQTGSNYYYRFDGKRWKAEHLDIAPLVIHDLIVDNHQTVWIATDQSGLVIRQAGNSRTLSDKNGLCSNSIYDLETYGPKLLASGGDGINLISRRDGSVAVDTLYAVENASIPLIKYHPKTGVLFKQVDTSSEQHSAQIPMTMYQLRNQQLQQIRPVNYSDITHLAIDSQGSFYLGSKTNGLMKYSVDGPVIQFRQKDSPVANQLSDILIGRNDEIWIAHPLGINVFYKSPFYHFTTAHGFADNRITAISAGEGDVVYFGHPDGRITRVTETNVEIINVPARFPDAGPIHDLILDHQQNLLIAAQNNRLLRFSPAGTLSEITRGSGDPLIYHRFLKGTDSTIYAAGRTGQNQDIPKEEYSSHLVEIIGDSLVPGTAGPAHQDTLIDYGSAAFNNSGILYAKYRTLNNGAGIFKVHPDGSRTLFPASHHLLGNVINDIFIDRHDRIWVAQRGGVALYRDKEWSSLTARDNIQSSIIHSIFEDQTGSIWIVGNIDVSRYQDGRITSYTFKEGLFEKEISQGIGTTDSRGRVWIGTDQGVYMYRAGISPEFPPGPKVNLAITRLLIDGIDQPVHPENGVITLPHSVKSLEIQFESVYLRSPGKVYYQTKMEGINDSWSPKTSQNSVLYSHLSPGKYRFHVRSGVQGFDESELIRTLSPIRIEIPFWQNPYILAGAVFSLLLGGLVVSQFRYVLKRKNEERLTQEVREKTKKIRSLNAEILKIEDRQREHIATELHDRVAQYLAMARNYISHVKDGVKDSQYEIYLQSAYRLINKSIDDTRLLIRELNPPVLEEYGLLAAIEWLSEQMNEHYRITTQVVKNVNGQLTSQTDIEIQTILFQAVRELLNNVVKHSNATHVKLEISESQSMLWITVSDDGVGFDPAAEIQKDGNAGFGLRNIRMRLEQIEGKFQIISAQSAGTTVKVGAPKSINNPEKQGYDA